MKIAIVSDIHLGDEQCALINSKTRKLTREYDKFKKHVGQGNDFLVLAGDILDFSVSRYRDTYECARIFFNQVLEDDLARQFIYLPGNHDANVWHTVEHETNIINQMDPDKKVRRFRHSVPGVIDDRQSEEWDKFYLHGVTEKPKGSSAKYGGLYIDKLIKGNSVFNIAHPNLHLVSDSGVGILITHGHYFQQYWALAGWIAMAVAKEDLALGALETHEIVGMNFPLVQLACTGVGQSGPLNPVINKIQKDVKSGELDLVRKYVRNMKKTIDDLWKLERFDNWLRFLNIREKLSDKLLDFLEETLLDKIEEISKKEGGIARGNEKFQFQQDVQMRMGTFYQASLLELDTISKDKDCVLTDLPVPDTLVYGHTHIPKPWKGERKLATLPLEYTGGRIVRLMNCGGWLKDKNGVFRGANVFKYETGTSGLRSEKVQ
jgi:predicted phosphodiesterase